MTDVWIVSASDRPDEVFADEDAAEERRRQIELTGGAMVRATVWAMSEGAA